MVSKSDLAGINGRLIIPVIKLAISEVVALNQRNCCEKVGQQGKPSLQPIYKEKSCHARFDSQSRFLAETFNSAAIPPAWTTVEESNFVYIFAAPTVGSRSFCRQIYQHTKESKFVDS